MSANSNWKKAIFGKRHGCVFLAVLWLAGGMTAPLKAQSFLEKLEQAVREQIEQQPPGSDGELPAPKKAPIPPATPKTPGDTLPVPPPVTPDATASAPASGASSGVYLGLEAEEAVGGGIGVRVAAVAEQSPAWKAGFEVGDRILAVNGFAIANLNSMAEQMSKTAPGQSVRFLITRAGRNTQLTAVLMNAELAGELTLSPSGPDARGSAWLGVQVNDVTSSFRQQFGITVFRGAAVATVAANSPAQKAGIRPGEAIIEADGTPIDGANDLSAWMSQTTPGQKVELVVYRGGFPRAVELVLEANPDEVRVRRVSPAPAPAPSRGTVMNAGPDLATRAEPANTAVPAPPIPVNPVDDVDTDGRIQKLEAENASLQDELARTRQELAETRAKLDQILKLLNDR